MCEGDIYMKIAVLCIATNFKIRMKIGNKSLLKQEEKISMAKILKELGIWIQNSKDELVPIIITNYDEIYEMAVQKHFLSFKNEFGFVSEGHAIRFGITAYPDADAYFIVSTGETKIFHAEIFEALCEFRRENLNKIVISNVNNKLTLPMVFSNKFIEPIQSIVDRENGKFVLRSSSKNAISMEITEELMNKSDFHPGIESVNHHSGSNNNYEKPDMERPGTPKKVVLIRGGGRLATSIAISLHQFGYCVLITETSDPATIYRGMSFARAVLTSETRIGGVTANLVSPSQVQIQKAWDAKSIPVIIDPNLDILQLFNETNTKKSLTGEYSIDKPEMDILTYLKKERELPSGDSQNIKNLEDGEENKTCDEQASFFYRYPLFALIDATPSKNQNPTNTGMASVTIGFNDDLQPKEDVQYKIRTSIDSQYGRIVYRRDFQVSRVDLNNTGEKIDEVENQKKDENREYLTNPDTGFAHSNKDNKKQKENAQITIVHTPCSGIYKGSFKIGDEVREGSIIGLLEKDDGGRLNIVSPINGRLIGNAPSNHFCGYNEELAAIDSSGITKEDCCQPLPIDKAVAHSVLYLLQKQTEKPHMQNEE